MNSITTKRALALCIIAAIGVGCAHHPPSPLTLDSQSDNQRNSGKSGLSSDEFSGSGSNIGQVKTVYFDYDSYALRAETLTTLKTNADVFETDRAKAHIQIEGHCDERGTQEYNLALGEQRALAVRHYLVNLGVSGARISTISYGEERPADPGQTEAAFALNRRCEFNVTAH